MKKNSSFPKLLFFALLLTVWMLAGGASLSASDRDARSYPSPEMAGWKQSGEIQIFSRANLYEYINGGADLFLKYDFQELQVAEYRNDQKASITIEVYRHQSPVHAFGIYSQERLGDADYLEIGAQGYSDRGILNFLSADCYVKMSSVDVGPEEQAVLIAFANKIVENSGKKGSLPSILSSFPSEGKKKNSEKYISREFLGYPFFHSGFTADYELSDKKFKLFVIEGIDPKDCRNMIQEYLKKAGQPDDKVEEGRYKLKDPYHGGMDFHWKGNYIWGALDLDDETLRSRVLNLFAGRLVPATTSPVIAKQIEPGIYLFTGGRGANTGAYIGEKEVLLIDSKQDSESVGQVLAAIRKLTNNPVTRLVNTHSDGDHVFGNRFQPAGVTVIAHENCLKEFFLPSMNGTPSDWNSPALKEFLPSVTYRDRMDILVGTKRIQLYYFGVGHTTGDTVVYFPDEKVAFIGDQIFTTRAQLIHAYKGGSSFGEVAVLERMLSAIDARKFVCGHNDVIDRAAVQNHITQMKALQEKVRDLKVKGRGIEEVKKQFEQNQSALVQTIYNETK